MKTFYLLFFLGLSFTHYVSASDVGDIFKTSTGAIFEMVNDSSFGKVWQSQDGLRWSSAIGFFRLQEAIDECKKLDGQVPSLEQYRSLRNYFEMRADRNVLTQRALNELYELFPDLESYSYFWTSTRLEEDHSLAFIFDGVYGTLGSGVMETYIPVYTQCVRILKF